jgi:Kef-type K+ transport system membrane component KefB
VPPFRVRSGWNKCDHSRPGERRFPRFREPQADCFSVGKQSRVRGRHNGKKNRIVSELHALFVIGFVAVSAPLLARLPAFARVPAVVLELLLGIVIGPSGFGWVTSQGAIGFLGEFGLIFLFFQAGFEFNPEKIGAAPLRLGAATWLAAFGLSCLFAGFLYAIGIMRGPLLVALVMPTTAFGILIPILRDSNVLDTNFGRHVLGAAVAGELGPLVLASIILAHQHHHLHETMLTMVFFSAAIGIILAARQMRSPRLWASIAWWMHDRSILPVRIALLILLALVSLANELGMELVLGAYTAGLVIAMLVEDTRAEVLENRLMSIGSGFFIPVFFITSGVEFDLPGLFTSPGSVARLVLFCAGFLLIRIIPLPLYKKALPESDLLPLALFSSTTLGLVIAITFLGVRTGDMRAENANALVGAAVVTVTVFPALALMLRAKGEGAEPQGAVAIAVHRAANFASAQYSRLIEFVAAKTSGKRDKM